MSSYDLRLKQEEVDLINKDGVKSSFVMYEATGTERDMQQKFVAKRSAEAENQKLTDMTGVKENFIGMLLHHKDNDAPVGAAFCIGFPGAIRNQLFDLAQTLSGMKTEAELLSLLMERELQKLQDKEAAEKAGEEYIDPDVEYAKKLEEEKASGKE